MTMSSLTDEYIPVYKSYGERTHAIDRVTVHHMAGNCSIETCAEVFKVPGRSASSNYGVDSDGRIGCYVPEDEGAWTSNSLSNDNRAITIEVADYDCEDWIPSDAAYEATVKLCADICDRYGIEPSYTGDTDGTFTEHMMFASTGCPGPWWHARMSSFVEDVRSAMKGEFDMTLDELLNDSLATADDGKVPVWQLWSWAFTHARRTEKKCDEIMKRLDKIEAGGVDYAKLAKAVNDDAAARMKS